MTWLDDLTLETVVVHTTHDMSIKGLKSSVYDDCLVLKEARVLEDDGMSKILDGEVTIPRERVHFIQVLAPGDA
jgi:ABC-type phosphonate transport system ATPase subunit